MFLVPTTGARLARVNTDAVFDASSETVVLYPENGGNLHCFTALTPCAVLDVMGPPYNRDEGRDCAYYSESPYSGSCGEFLLLPISCRCVESRMPFKSKSVVTAP